MNGDNKSMEIDPNESTPPQLNERSPDGDSRRRFLIELEFVQALANPHYLNFLAQHGYFRDKAFVNYLNYLQYWKRQEYVKFVKYPQCLHFLDLLQSEHFRRELINNPCTKFIEEQQLLHWQYNAQSKIRSAVDSVRNVTSGKENDDNQYKKSTVAR